MITQAILGQGIKLNAHFSDQDAVALDPTTVTFKIISPSGQLEVFVYGTDLEVQKSSVGYYYISYAPLEAGVFHYRWQGEGNISSALEGSFEVLHSGLDHLIELEVEDGSSKSTANTYLDLISANQILGLHPEYSDWAVAPVSKKSASLVRATSLIDRSIVWKGERILETQSLQFPRNECEGIPLELKQAVAEMALYLITAGEGFSDFNATLRIGDVRFDSSGRQSIPTSIWQKISHLGQLKSAKAKTVKIERS